MRFGPEFAVVFAAVLALNGQEWYQDGSAPGPAGRRLDSLVDRGAAGDALAPSSSSSAVAITGFGKAPGRTAVRLRLRPNDFPFEAAEFLARREDIKGNVLNTTLAQGDALIWRAYPPARPSSTAAPTCSPRELLDEHHRLRNAIRDDDVAGVEGRNSTSTASRAVMIDSGGAPKTYRRLMQSPNWIPFYDDGRVVMFGRADAAEPDLTAFKNNRLEPELKAYKVAQPVPSADRPPTPTSWIDEIFQNRLAGPATVAHERRRPMAAGGQPRRRPARHSRPGAVPAGHPRGPHRAGQEPRRLGRLPAARRGLSLPHAAGDGDPGRHPADAREPGPRISMLTPNIDVLNTRFRQRVTALNYAIQTTPPPGPPRPGASCRA